MESQNHVNFHQENEFWLANEDLSEASEMFLQQETEGRWVGSSHLGL